MAKAIFRPEITQVVQKAGFTLELTIEEARALRSLTGRCSGEGDMNEAVENVYLALADEVTEVPGFRAQIPTIRLGNLGFSESEPAEFPDESSV